LLGHSIFTRSLDEFFGYYVLNASNIAMQRSTGLTMITSM